MAKVIDLDALLAGCADDSFDDGIRIDTGLVPLTGPGGPVKPAVYAGGTYQVDRRWASPVDESPTPVIVIDNIPSQANRLEDAIRRHRESTRVPEMVLDLSDVGSLPAHLPRQLSSLQFPHRNADAYLRDARLDGADFTTTDLGRTIFEATPQTCGPLMAWFPQALLYGFWQTHLGKKRQTTKHARAWVSEIVGWDPAATDTKVLGLKGDPLNLNTDEAVTTNPDDLVRWDIGKKEKVEGGRKGKLSEIGHGLVPFMGDNATAAAVSFARVTQRATVSFAHLRRIALGPNHSTDADVAARALLVVLGLHAHVLAFGRGFALRSGAELRPKTVEATWLGSSDGPCTIGDANATLALLRSAVTHATSAGVPLDGWDQPALMLTPKDNLRRAIRATWPELVD